MTGPLTPEQAEFQQLYPPHVYFAMPPETQALAWAQFAQAKAMQLQQVASHRSMVHLLIFIFVVLPLIGAFIWAIVFAIYSTSV